MIFVNRLLKKEKAKEIARIAVLETLLFEGKMEPHAIVKRMKDGIDAYGVNGFIATESNLLRDLTKGDKDNLKVKDILIYGG